MILAAGRGTRLGEIGERTPKALLEVGGIAMIARTARRLIDAGADRIIVNVHHHAAAIERFIADHGGFGVDVRISHEEQPLETGGGLLKAKAQFRGDRPILIHNVDILTDLDLRALLDAQRASGALAMLAVSEREATRYLMFDERGLCGHADRAGTERFAREPAGEVRRLGFTGVHAVSPALLDRLEGDGPFSIMTTYLRLAAAGTPILPFDTGGANWMDIGTPERLEAARRAFA